MPVIQEQNPLAAALGAASGVLSAKRQNDEADRDYLLRKAGLDAQTREADARTALDNATLHDNRRLRGLDPSTGNPVDTGVPDAGPNASLDDQFKNLILKANAYQKQGAYDLANQVYAQADRVQTQLHQAKQDALAYMKEADARLKIIAQAQHWSNQEKETARHNMQDEAIRIRNGSLTYDAAMARVGATLQAAEIRAGVSMRGQDLAHGDRQAALKALTQRYEQGLQGNRGKAPKIDPTKGIGALPGPVQSVIIKMRKQGVTDQGILQMVESSQAMDQATKDAVKKALTPAAPLPPVNLNPGRGALLKGAQMKGLINGTDLLGGEDDGDE